jgi:hypothetical protein
MTMPMLWRSRIVIATKSLVEGDLARIERRSCFQVRGQMDRTQASLHPQSPRLGGYTIQRDFTLAKSWSVRASPPTLRRASAAVFIRSKIV